MDAFASYTVATSSWLALQAMPMLFTPSVLLPLLVTGNSHASASPVTHLATYLARSLALSSLSLAAISLLLSGLLPTSSASNENAAAAFAVPVTFITTVFHFFTAFHAYTAYTASGSTMFFLGVVGSGFLAAFGTWCALFGTGGHVSKRTGKDKRLSGWPFGDRKGRATDLKET